MKDYNNCNNLLEEVKAKCHNKWRIRINKIDKGYWIFGINFVHRSFWKDTYLHISFFRWEISIGYLVEFH